jgi:sulfatase modifying factor 1
MLKRLLILPLVYLLFCSPNRLSNNVPSVSYAGMRKIEATGKSFVQGAIDPQSTPDEQPGMESKFTYDYWLDTTEVTQQEYANVMGLQPVPATSAYGIGNQYPVYNVSWYDAILFCNKKSKRDSLDTVYSYFGTPKINSGSVYAIDGLRINTSGNGYRLPTESEWEYAARESTSTIPFPHLSDSATAQAYAWYSSNAKGTTQPVATRLPNAFGLYDMAGNVFEWMQDWKCYYTVESITNSMGAPLPKESSEKIVKGGSFEHGFISLRPSRRQTTYQMSLSQYAEYIGFRCARAAKSIVYNLRHFKNFDERDEFAFVIDTADYRHDTNKSCVCQCYKQFSDIVLH